jgi:hypothetical protein
LINFCSFFKKVTSEEQSDAHKLESNQKVEILSKLLKHLNNVETRFVHGRDLELNNSDDDDEYLPEKLSSRFVHGRDLEDNETSQSESSEENNEG